MHCLKLLYIFLYLELVATTSVCAWLVICLFLALCLCDEGGHCFGCKNKNHGSPDMPHPVEADADTGGHLDGYLPFDFDALSSSDDDVW